MTRKFVFTVLFNHVIQEDPDSQIAINQENGGELLFHEKINGQAIKEITLYINVDKPVFFRLRAWKISSNIEREYHFTKDMEQEQTIKLNAVYELIYNEELSFREKVWKWLNFNVFQPFINLLK